MTSFNQNLRFDKKAYRLYISCLTSNSKPKRLMNLSPRFHDINQIVPLFIRCVETWLSIVNSFLCMICHIIGQNSIKGRKAIVNIANFAEWNCLSDIMQTIKFRLKMGMIWLNMIQILKRPVLFRKGDYMSAPCSTSAMGPCETTASLHGTCGRHHCEFQLTSSIVHLLCSSYALCQPLHSAHSEDLTPKPSLCDHRDVSRTVRTTYKVMIAISACSYCSAWLVF